MWVVFNEGWGQHDTVDITNTVIKVQTIGKDQFYKRSLSGKVFKSFLQADPSRLVSCASGWTDHPVGHVVDAHVYPGPVTSIFPDKTNVRGKIVYIDDH